MIVPPLNLHYLHELPPSPVQKFFSACRGQIDVMHYLAGEAQLQPSMSVLFLTPCHATPWFSHVHASISMEFLDCSPPGIHHLTALLTNYQAGYKAAAGDEILPFHVLAFLRAKSIAERRLRLHFDYFMYIKQVFVLY